MHTEEIARRMAAAKKGEAAALKEVLSLSEEAGKRYDMAAKALRAARKRADENPQDADALHDVEALEHASAGLYAANQFGPALAQAAKG